MGGGKYKKRRFYKTIEKLTFKNMVKYETDQLKSKFTSLFDKHQSKTNDHRCKINSHATN